MKGLRIIEPKLLLLPVIATLFLLLVSWTTSPLATMESGDSSIYKLLGMGILHGKLPYVDLFDNKGTYLYLINAFGMWLIPGRWGIFVIQVVSLSVTLYFFYRTARLFCSSKTAFISVLLTLFLLAGCCHGGNHVEEYMLPFISLSFYLVTDLFMAPEPMHKTLWKRFLAWGICFGVVLMLRPNDAVGFFGGLMIGVLCWLAQRKEWRQTVVGSILFFAGAMVALAPIVIWYASEDALSGLWYGVYGANSKMAGGMVGQLATLLKWGKWAVLLLMLTLCVMIVSTNHKAVLWFVVPMCMLQLLFIGGKLYAHYFIPLFPLMALFMAMLFCQKNKAVVVLAVAILCLSHRPLPRMAILELAADSKVIASSISHRSTETKCPIPEEEKGSVWNYSLDSWREGVPMAWLINNDIVQCNRKTGSLDADIKEIDFYETNPLWVASYEDEFGQHEASSGYRLAEVVPTEHFTIHLYKRK